MNALSRGPRFFQPDTGIVYTIETASNILEVSRRRIALYCKYGWVEPAADPRACGWFFDDEALRMVRRIETLRVVCGGSLAGVQRILELEDEIERLAAELRFLRG